MRKLVTALLALALLGCGSEETAHREQPALANRGTKPIEQVQKKQAAPEAAASNADNIAAACVEAMPSASGAPSSALGESANGGAVRTPPVAAEMAPPAAAQLAYADKIMAWNNRVQDILARGTLADKVAACKDIYDETWRLPKRPKGFYVRDFAPAPGLIKGADARQIDALLAAMNKASDEMLRAYGRLEAYVQDPLIQDDGKQGRAIVKEISSKYGDYLTARKDFLAILDEKAQKAEDILLQGHPLQRQITLARSIFNKFREIGQLVLTDAPQEERLRACEDKLADLIIQASRPPFLASGDYERLYRQFLRSVENYVKTLKRGLNEGLHAVQKRELLVALNSCREKYNTFAAAINDGQ